MSALSTHVLAQLEALLQPGTPQPDAAAADTGPARLHQALRLLAKWRSVLIQNTLVQQQGLTVGQGPFQGMAFIAQSAEGCHVPKLLGCYEQPLHPLLASLPARRYDTVLNVGCAEGYYAVGLARLLPQAQVRAHDLNPQAQHACQDLARRNGVQDRVQVGGLLLECGWHANDFIAGAYAEAAQQACPSVQVRSLDGRDAAQRQQAWGAADLFCSLSDNIQETFGITPVEAMAAGLPVVVSDWDGYRDTVQHGVQGFCVPTLMPPPGLGEDLAWRHGAEVDTYDMHCGHACSFVAVDIPATAAAFQRLFQDEALRRQMGAAGQARARQLYDWSVIIPAYEALWAELAAQRQAALQAPQALPPPAGRPGWTPGRALPPTPAPPCSPAPCWPCPLNCRRPARRWPGSSNCEAWPW